MLAHTHELHRDAARRISPVYVSRSLDWMERLDEAKLDNLGRTAAVHLEEYGFPEVKEKTAYRTQKAFLSGAALEGVIDFIAHISMSCGGVRYALELFFEAEG